MSETLDKIDAQSRIELKALLAQCTEKQQELFVRMYGHGMGLSTGLEVADVMPEEKIRRAIVQCEATIKKNLEK